MNHLTCCFEKFKLQTFAFFALLLPRQSFLFSEHRRFQTKNRVFDLKSTFFPIIKLHPQFLVFIYRVRARCKKVACMTRARINNLRRFA